MSAGWEIREGDAVERLREFADGCVDAVVCDPPYGLEFMGKDWDRPWAVSADRRVGFEGREDNLTLPAHRDSRNANCRRCGGRARGAKRCECSDPLWDRAPVRDEAAAAELDRQTGELVTGFRFVGVERDAEYAAIARARIEFWAVHPTDLPVEAALEADAARRRTREGGQLGLNLA